MRWRDRYDSLFQYYGTQHAVPWNLLKAQAYAESGLNPDAVSRVGALGLTQFMPATWAELVARAGWIAPGKLIDPRDPEDAIAAQARYMRWLLSETGSIPLALAAYNWGIGRVRRTFLQAGRPWDPALAPAETREYVRRVLAIWESDDS
jgi:membrane-bound lytic murein transglycosylase D